MQKTASCFKFISFFVIFFVLLLFSIDVFAHRPLVTEDAGVGALGEFVFEAAWEYGKEENDTANAAFLAFVVGLGRGEIAVEGPYQWIKYEEDDGGQTVEKKESGIGDLNVFGKLLLLGSSEKSGMFTIKAEAKTVTGDEEKGLGSGFWEYGGSAVLSKQLAMFIIHAQGGYTYVDDEDEENSYFYGLAIDWLISDTFTFCIEGIGAYNSEEKPLSIHGGIIVQINDALAFDVLGGKGITEEADDLFVTVGLTLTL